MTTTRSIIGRPEVHAIFREVWADQIDNYGDDCPVCQQEDQMIECNVYVPVRDGGGDHFGTCNCCSIVAALDVADRDLDRDVLIEFSGGSRK